MATDERDRSGRGMSRLKAYGHIAMGIVYLAFAFLVFNAKQFGAIELSEGIAYALGGILILYGLFRLWRGIVDIRMLKNSEPE